MSAQNKFLLFMNAALFALFVWLFVAQGTPLLRPGPGWEYKDLVAILLSVVSIVVTFIGIMVAVAAIWGYQSIKAIAEQKAEETSRAGCDDYLMSEPCKAALAIAISEQIENEVRSLVQNDLGAGVLSFSEAGPRATIAASEPRTRRTRSRKDSAKGKEDEPWED